MVTESYDRHDIAVDEFCADALWWDGPPPFRLDPDDQSGRRSGFRTERQGMSFVSFGIRVALRSSARKRDGRRSGFTLLEALVALTIVLAFAAVLGPFLFHARRITANADGRVAAQILLRALLEDPLDPAGLASLSREGETAGLRWRIAAQPSAIRATLPRRSPPPRATGAPAPAPPQRPNWAAYRVIASVSWAQGESISGETVRLGKPE
jgi:prepilin-type N-terminal cleavage/methylation domain-containing protein